METNIRPQRLGEVVFYGLIRLAVLILVSWIVFANQWLSFNDWWWATVALVAGAVIYPAQLQYAEYKKIRTGEIEGLLCASCKHFDEENILCSILDEHPRQGYIPCEGEGWEAKTIG